MRRIGMAAMAVAVGAVLGATGACGEEAVGGASAVEEAWRAIQSLGLEVDESAAMAAAAEAVLRTADPGAKVYGAEEWAALSSDGTEGEGGAEVESLPTGIGYVKIRRMDAAAADAAAAALLRWAEEGVVGAVLDVRGAGGRDENAVERVAGLFAARNGSWRWKVREAGGEKESVRGEGGGEEQVKYPVMVLTDGETSGAAELLAAVFGGGVRGGMTVGTVTAGDPMVREAVEIGGGRMAVLRARVVETGDGRRYDGREGVEPDVALSEAALAEVPEEAEEPTVSFRRTKKGVLDEEKEDKELRERVKEDAVLRRAVDVIQGLEALGYGG